MLLNAGMEHLLTLRGRISLGSKVGGGRSGGREESSENWLNDGSEDDLSTVGGGESHPEDKDELEDVVECCHMSVVVKKRYLSTYGTNIQR